MFTVFSLAMFCLDELAWTELQLLALEGGGAQEGERWGSVYLTDDAPSYEHVAVVVHRGYPEP